MTELRTVNLAGNLSLTYLHALRLSISPIDLPTSQLGFRDEILELLWTTDIPTWFCAREAVVFNKDLREQLFHWAQKVLIVFFYD